jgi:hypothetical protein
MAKGRKKQKPLNKMTAAERRAFLQKESITGGRANLRGFTPSAARKPSQIAGSSASTSTNSTWGSRAQKAALAKAQKASAAARRKFKKVTGKSQATYSGR